MSHHDYDRKYNQPRYEDPGFNPFSPLIVGAIAVLVALVAFLLFSGTTGTQQAEFNTTPPAATTPAPPAPAEKGPNVIPNTPPAEQPKAQ